MDDLNKSIDSLITELFSEQPVEKADANLDVASAAKTTADAAIAAAPALQDDAARGAGRPKQISDVPKVDEDGARAKTYDDAITERDGVEDENPEAKKQARSIDQTTGTGRLSKTLTEEEAAEFEEFKKSKVAAAEKAKQEELRKSEDLKKAELESLVKAHVEQALAPVKKENEELKKSLGESQALIKAMAGQPQRAKSVTGIEALEKSTPESTGPQEFTKSEKLDAAESLVKSGKLPVEAVIELENTNTVYRRDWQQAIEAELQKRN